ncbi:hypothetical protein AGMMS49975_20280 [Clostridia bacterium]|nr:hypothetical protein AGMMS49975_20280 [Clostridia bacterium]
MKKLLASLFAIFIVSISSNYNAYAVSIEPLKDSEIIDSFNNSNEYSFRMSYWAAMMEQDIYDGNWISTANNGFEKSEANEIGSDEYYIGYRDVGGLGTVCLINIKGTDALSLKDWNSIKDWSSNFSPSNAFDISTEFPKGDSATAHQFAVHLGFRNSAYAIYNDIVKKGYLNHYSDSGSPKELYYLIIGHSRGGALAEILSLIIPRETGVDDSHILAYTHAAAPYAFTPLKTMTSDLLRGHIYKTINDLDIMDDLLDKMPEARNMTVANTIVVIPKDGITPYVNDKGEQGYDYLYYHNLDSDYIPWLKEQIVNEELNDIEYSNTAYAANPTYTLEFYEGWDNVTDYGTTAKTELRKKLISKKLSNGAEIVDAHISFQSDNAPRSVDDKKIIPPADYKFLMVNGSLVPEANIKTVRGTSLVPVRIISERLGAIVKWDATTKSISINNDTTSIILVIDSKQATVNGKTVTLDEVAQNIDGVTYVPLRFVSEYLGANVGFYEKSPFYEYPVVWVDSTSKSEKVTVSKENSAKFVGNALKKEFEQKKSEYLQPEHYDTIGEYIYETADSFKCVDEFSRYWVIGIDFESGATPCYLVDKYNGDMFGFSYAFSGFRRFGISSGVGVVNFLVG